MTRERAASVFGDPSMAEEPGAFVVCARARVVLRVR